MEKKQMYRVKLYEYSKFKPDQIKDGYLAIDGKEIMEYTRGIAIKKAAAFGGKIEKAPDKVVKKESFKLWITIEKLTEHTDGSEEYTDVEMDEAYPLTSTGDIKTLEEAHDKAKQISEDIYPR